MSPELKQFIKENKILINENTQESWEEIYKKLSYTIKGEFTQTLLSAGIDPAVILGYIPDHYLRGSNIQNYKIPSNVISIGNDAFISCHNLTSITIPDSVTTISYRAFINCDSLTSVVIPDSVTSIGNWAFQWCHSLTSVVIGNSVTNIGYQAFCYCSDLTSVIIPDSVTSIGDGVFSRCSSLKEIIFKGTRKQAIQLGIGNMSKKKWRKDSPIKKIICTDGEINL